MLTKEIVKQNIDLFNCLGLEGGGDDEQAKVLYEFNPQHNIPGGLVILVSSTFNDDLGDEDFKERDTRSTLTVFLEGKGFIANIYYQAWSEDAKYEIRLEDRKLILVKNYKETIVKKPTKYEYDAETKKFSYHNGKEAVYLDNVTDTEVDYYEFSGKNIFDFDQFDSTVKNERFAYMSFDDIEPGLFAFKVNIVDLLENRVDGENIDIIDGGWTEFPYPDDDESFDKLFMLINEALDAGGGEKEIEKVCDDCRNGWEEEDDEEE